MSKFKKLIKIFLVTLVLFVGMPTLAQSVPRVYLEGPHGELAPGSEVTVSVFVDTKDPINALDLTLYYPTSKLSFLGSDNTASIVNIWQTKPEARGGSIPISAGIIKSFAGEHGHLIKFSFKLLSAGEANVDFTKTDLYLADGQGTKVVAGSFGATITIKEGAPVVNATFTPFTETPTDLLIAGELEKIKETNGLPRPPSKALPIAILVLIIVAICVVVRYNKPRIT